MRKLLFAVVFVGSLAAQRAEKYICKSTHLGVNAVAITCLNGADPTGTKVGNTLIISCGK